METQPRPLRKRGPKPTYGSHAERQRAFRERRKLRVAKLDELLHILQEAAAHGRSARHFAHLPENPDEWVPALAERLKDKRIVVCKREGR
jgi:hypothetical protein